MSYYGNPSNFPLVQHAEDIYATESCGGQIKKFTAGVSLSYGDAVYLNPVTLRAEKTLESSMYPAFFLGYVCGGTTLNGNACIDSALVGTAMSVAGELVCVGTRGTFYGALDGTGTILAGTKVGPGRTTAGRVIGDQNMSYANNYPNLAIKAGGSALVKATNAVATVAAGAPGTSTAAALDQAALSGTTANGKYAVYVFRVASDGTTVTSARSADSDTQAAIVWPAASTTLITLGCVLVHPTGTGGFIGGTTALDDATVVPNAKYYNFVGARNNLGTALETVSTTAGTALKILVL